LIAEITTFDASLFDTLRTAAVAAGTAAPVAVPAGGVAGQARRRLPALYRSTAARDAGQVIVMIRPAK